MLNRSASARHLRRLLPCRVQQAQSFVMISAARLDEFMQAELSLFASKRLEPLRFLDVVRSSASLVQLGQLVHKELPVRFARRIKHIQRVDGWDTIPELRDLHAMHLQSFRELRLASPLDTVEFPEAVRNIRQRHKRIPTLFAEAVKRIDDDVLLKEPQAEDLTGEEQTRSHREAVDQWAEAFLRSRVATEMLMSHYVAYSRSMKDQPGPGVSGANSTQVGIMDMQCDPWQICSQVIAQIQEGPRPCLVEAENTSGHITFCYVPRYLFYIMNELLQNSARVSAEAASASGQDAKPIRVSLCADDRQVVIRISDRGGGIPSAQLEQIWSYKFTTSRANSQQDYAAQLPDLNRLERLRGGFAGMSPISGRGIGLPLCRLYAKYLGGSLKIINLPGLGVDAYVFLNRIDPSELQIERRAGAGSQPGDCRNITSALVGPATTSSTQTF
eukprot:TRINITY_DN22655_c0_g1_i2.p1 TRINITY_DN22655_c0_g1~~TRINITY_DN22655_c0_g1_i2.p1  ORF type:complete len:444 (+),score=71.21 TRINITY_DN22655_c0_g1_i2:34-1365(+)